MEPTLSTTFARQLKQKLAESLNDALEHRDARMADAGEPLGMEPPPALRPAPDDERPTMRAITPPEPVRMSGLDSPDSFLFQALPPEALAWLEAGEDQGVAVMPSNQMNSKPQFGDTLSLENTGGEPPLQNAAPDPVPGSPLGDGADNPRLSLNQTVNTGGSMADLSGYKDLSRAPLTLGEEARLESVPQAPTAFERLATLSPETYSEAHPEVADTEFSGNVQTLIRLVNELPEGVTKQTGAQIIRLTMEAMGISMEDVLSEAQSAQSEMLDAVRANIKKIEEYKTVIRKLETDIKYYQGRANELSEIIDLFILSNTSSKVSGNDEFSR